MGKSKGPAIRSAMKAKSARSAGGKRPEAQQKRSLTRKDREYVQEFGVLDPNDIRDEPGEAFAPKRVYTEAEIDRDLYASKRAKYNHDRYRQEEVGAEEEDEWNRPSKYAVYLKSLGTGQRSRLKDLLGDDDDDEEEENHDEKQASTSSDSEVDEQETTPPTAAADDAVDSTDDEEDAVGPLDSRIDDLESDNDDNDDGDAGADADYFSRHFADKPERLRVVKQRVDAIAQQKPSHFAVAVDTSQCPSTDVSAMVYQAVVGSPSPPPSTLITASDDIDLGRLKIKARILSKLQQVVGDAGLTSLQSALLPFINRYQDLLFCNRTVANAAELRQLYCIHVLNHVFKYRDRILRNNGKLAERAEAEVSDANGHAELPEIRDQGFTRPKVLIIAPFRNAAFNIVNTLVQLSAAEQQQNYKRFRSEYSIPKGQDTISADKPVDFQDTFRGNIDDCFQVGLKFTRKALKIYSSFYSSDIIICSPLGLRMLIGNPGEKKRDFDFLSSIEVVVLDQAHHINMQNWEHLTHVFDHLNLIPTQSRDTDFSRVRNWYLDGNAKCIRQTLIFSEYLFPELQALFSHYANNVDGRYRVKGECEGVMSEVLSATTQTFQRIDCSLRDADEVRFKFFVEKVMPRLRTSTLTQSHTLIYIPSYFDYVRVRNYMDSTDWDFEAICEYSSAPDVARARTLFHQSRCQILLYTERFHFFRRHKLKGVKHVIFYGLPENALHYAEMINCVLLPGLENLAHLESTSLALFTRWDALKLERIVGTGRVKKMMEGKGVYKFV
ncbi:rRNA-binding ribosome biosynthesis protein utp25 [Sorochytrium milnesiophthora]